MNHGIRRRIAFPLLVGALALAQAACIEDETFVPPPLEQEDAFFQRYVALGNSLTAGFMSGGINDSTQQLAYPVLLAQMAGVESYGYPSLAMPGCPPPLVGVIEEDSAGVPVLEQDRVAGGSESTCERRRLPTPELVLNVAVPGARIADAFNIDRPGNASNPLTQLFLGGRTQIEAMRDARPTFVTMWLGNNDAMAGVIAGDTTLMTPMDTFRTYGQRIAQAIDQQDPLGVVLIGVIDVQLSPLIQPGLYYWLADSLDFLPRPARSETTRLTVNDDCGPTDAGGAFNPLSMNRVSFRAIADPNVLEISCDPAAPYVITPAERVVIDERIDAYNDFLSQEAQSRGWVYLSSTLELNSQLSGAAGHNRLRRCLNLTNTLTPEQMVTIVTAQCPHPSAPNFFGSFLSYDGLHMSAEAHEVMAEAIADVLNTAYDVDL